MKENKLGTIISKLRKEKGLTQKDLADKLNISDKAISRWETGGSSPDMDMIFRISKIFKISYNDLLAARVVDGENGEKIAQEISEEFTKIKKRNAKRTKIIIATALVIVLILTIAIIFTNTYNRFKVYNITIESTDFYPIKGVYVETRIKDTLHLGDIEIKGYEFKDTDTISVDLYFIKDNKEYIIKSYSSLDDINFLSYQSYIEIKDLSNYADDLYLKATIINSKGKEKTYIGKLTFVLDFSNNKIFYKENTITVNSRNINLNADEIKIILMENGFEEVNNNILVNRTDDYVINYIIDSNKINYNYEKNNFRYRYTYYLENGILKVSVFDENTTEIENYTYDILNDRIIECNTGSCNDYKYAMELLNENVLNLIYER
ncbi:MAG: helix-turn-helix domain-containing protein [Firmicutes bacterium]|nr:helix-turn-helix domain-containing protein [Bacillota bacterium]